MKTLDGEVRDVEPEYTLEPISRAGYVFVQPGRRTSGGEVAMTRAKITAMLAGTVFLAASAPALAATHRGTVSLYHLNGDVAGRGVCIQTAPAMPNTWACLWKTNGLYDEITTMLLEAYSRGKSCMIHWNSADPNGHNLIFAAECF